MSKPEDSDQPVPIIFPSQLARGRGAQRPGPPRRPAAGDGASPPEPAPSGLSLRVEERDRPAAARWLVCHDEPLTIGRSASCEVRLDDEQRVVSGHHARIELREGRYELTDLGSKNLTYLNGEPLTPDRPEPLAPGDRIEIGSFVIAVAPAEAEPAAPEAGEDTVLDPGFANPFVEPAAELAGTLERIAALWAAEPAGRRDTALRQALAEALAAAPDREALAAVGRLLARLAGPDETSD